MSVIKAFDSDALIDLIEEHQERATHIFLMIDGDEAMIYQVWKKGVLSERMFQALSLTRNRFRIQLNFSLSKVCDDDRRDLSRFYFPRCHKEDEDPVAIILRVGRLTGTRSAYVAVAWAVPCYCIIGEEGEVVSDPFAADTAYGTWGRYPSQQDLYELARTAVRRRRNKITTREALGMREVGG